MMNTVDFPNPAFRYAPDSDTIHILHPSARVIRHERRRGLNFTSIRGRAGLPRHTAGGNQGSVSLWVLPLQDFFPATHHAAHRRSNPFFERFVFLTDRESVQEIEAANFTLFYSSYWHPVLVGKFALGTVHESLFNTPGGLASAGHFEMRALKWYQLVMTWDHDSGTYVLYANGIKVGHSDTTATGPLRHDPPAPWLYFGNPAYAMGDITFYNKALTGGQVSQLFQREAVSTDPDIQSALEKTYAGRNLPKFDWQPSPDWKSGLSLPLRDEEDYAHFFHQGCGPSLRFTGEGLRITTPGMAEYHGRKVKTSAGDEIDMSRMYLWTRRVFEGDLHVTFEFKLHQHGGLALLMTQAAGMQGEDFLADYLLRSNGSMRVVCWEDVRNYHWEFYREMVDTRNDLVSHACLKNPWFRPMNFQVENRTWELDRWYRFTYLQESSRLRGAVDDVTVMDVTDTGFDNNGPVLRHGHIALRLMMRSDMTFRNLKVATRPDFEVEPVII